MHEPLKVLVGALGPGVLPSVDGPPPVGTILLDLGPEHPSNAGLLELDLWTEDGVITSARVRVGAMHRGAEKLFEVRDYRQILMLADRHDWQAPFFGELGIALTCEQMLGLEVPQRAVWLRTLLAEHTRISSHAGFLGYVPHRLGVANPFTSLRAALRVQLQTLTGNRVHPMVNRIGGLGVDAEPDWLLQEARLMTAVHEAADQLGSLLETETFVADTAGVAPLGLPQITGHGITGPAARASGVDIDLRRQRPYLAYGGLEALIPPPVTTTGDAWSRLRQLVVEVRTSAALVEACSDRLADLSGPVSVRLGKVVQLPEGEAYGAVEAPLGVAGVYLVSRGEKTPWRLKLRTPSFNHVAALESLLPGVSTAHLEVTLASVGYVIGDVDK